MTSRREQILATAAGLFAERGFHGVSVGELGAACGMSGPALYKHFPAKDAILAAMLVSISEELLSVGRTRVQEAGAPEPALIALVDWHVSFALSNKALIIVQDRDWASLPVEARERVRQLQREYVGLWAGQLRALDDGLSEVEALARAHAAFGLLNSTPHSAFLPEPEMRAMLTEMALRALGRTGASV
ncbi:TetR/AcrR family transcriptional regulator [Nocardioides donggukensis]|uniref:TetR/AcrR family transcriptional regulator n=1 Tax=Nocardioides donggukensis TaxID=2774019 RepID=A0A927K573_9ACTN|nr:TetR/AcrR family transcriptional regulator [Nocardioides donggukensis]MBD8868076.1 TetR/AcrR family transcriptional regulator [Nocardioides donggukensis]